jgi:hypothetical protein
MGTWALRICFSRMDETELIEQSFDIAWGVLLKSEDLGDPDASAKFLFREIVGRIRKGERRRLVLSNAAIDAYRHRFGVLILVD